MATPTIQQFGFHGYREALATQFGWFDYRQETQFTYTFENFFHPFVDELIQKLNRDSLPGMLDPKYHQSLSTDFFDDVYTLLTSKTVKINHFPKDIDLREGGPYANYNWELLFHVPLTIAVHLSKNQRFAEAQRWFHYIFDPTSTDMSVDPPQRFWKFLAFRNADNTKQIDELLALLSKPDAECSSDELDLKGKILAGYEAVRDKPFQPHAVARTRQIAYQYCVVMKYLDNLIAWGDSLFRQDTIETINEATQIYVLAANLLGERPQRIPPMGTVRPKTFAQLKAQGLDAMGNALVELEGQFPLNRGLPQTRATDPDAAAPLFGIGRTLYFCIPWNDRLLSYWDTVGDRLFKIRNCLNIEGVFRQLALFDPPLDPGMLVKAAAAGIDIGSVISGLNQPLSPVRSPLITQKALELCSEVRSLGAALLSAIEKEDGEHLARLRQSHEIALQQMSQDIRFLQWKQAQETTESLLRSRAIVLERYHYYQRLLGLTPDSENAPDTLPLDRRELSEENFDEAYSALVGQYNKPLTPEDLPTLRLAEESSPGALSAYSSNGRVYLSQNEDAELNTFLPTARDFTLFSSIAPYIASVLALIPDPAVNLHYWGLGATINLPIGSGLSKAAQLGGDVAGIIATWNRDQAGMASRYASYERRADEWIQQNNLATLELVQIGRQIIGSLIAEQVAHHEYLTVKKQIEYSQAIDQFLSDKFSNEELYAWMQGELSRLYYEYYRFAFDTARKAEQTMKHELMRPEVDATDYIKFNYWDGGRKGLLSGEALYLDVKRMEMAYHENNKREYELTKQVSLRQLNPVALLMLKATGTCEVTLPEWLFDLDCPGHYMRRIKMVSVSIPSVVGPYTSVNCTLSLLKSSLRTSPLLQDDAYVRQGSEDNRFIDYFGTIQSIVTSNGNNDSGLFEPNMRDERFLPFEGAGTDSTWRLELPAAFRQFDYNTIADVILHVRYTARQGGQLLRDGAIASLETLASTANASGLMLLLSLKHDFPSAWSRFIAETDDANFVTQMMRSHFPYITQGRTITIDAVQLASVTTDAVETITPPDLDLATYTTRLNDDGEFELSLAPDGAVLVRDSNAYVFLLIQYSMT